MDGSVRAAQHGRPAVRWRIRQAVGEGRTILFVSHGRASVQTIGDPAIVLDGGVPVPCHGASWDDRGGRRTLGRDMSVSHDRTHRQLARVARYTPPSTQRIGLRAGSEKAQMKGVLLAGGTGSRLHPLTLVTNKHLLPVHDRPMIYYPLETLRGMGIREVMVILGGRSIGDIVELLSDGRDFGLDLTYRYQRNSLGIAHAIGLTRDFVGDEPFCVVLGDNILHGQALADVAAEFVRRTLGRRHAPLPGTGPDALRRGGVRCRRCRRRVRGEADAAQERLDPHRRLLPATGRLRRHRAPGSVRSG